MKPDIFDSVCLEKILKNKKRPAPKTSEKRLLHVKRFIPAVLCLCYFQLSAEGFMDLANIFWLRESAFLVSRRPNSLVQNSKGAHGQEIVDLAVWTGGLNWGSELVLRILILYVLSARFSFIFFTKKNTGQNTGQNPGQNTGQFFGVAFGTFFSPCESMCGPLLCNCQRGIPQYHYGFPNIIFCFVNRSTRYVSPHPSIIVLGHRGSNAVIWRYDDWTQQRTWHANQTTCQTKQILKKNRP